jgi:hypothetical protein
VLNNRISFVQILAGVTVYDATGFGGAKWTYGPGNFPAASFVNVLNDRVESVKVAPGVTAKLCSETSGGGTGQTHGWGTCVTVEGDTERSSLGSFGNNTSNIEVIPGATVYTEVQYGGARQTFVPGTYNASQLRVGNDAITSLVVAPGYQATLCSETFGPGAGWCHTFTGNVTYVGQEFDNGASYVRVQPIVAAPVSTIPADPVLERN